MMNSKIKIWAVIQYHLRSEKKNKYKIKQEVPEHIDTL